MANNENKINNNYYCFREYNMKENEIEYNLRLEIIDKNIIFILSNLNEDLEYFYKSKIDLLTIINKFELNSYKYSDPETMLKIFDNIYKKKQISINEIEDNSYNITFKLLNILGEEIINEIKLFKEFMNDSDKFKYLFGIINSMKKNNNIKEKENKEIENIKKKLDELNTNINKRDEEIKDILNKKDIIIQKLNEKVINLENKYNKINNKNILNTNNFNESFNNKIKTNLINSINNQDVSINHLANDENEIMNQKDQSIKTRKKIVNEKHNSKSLIKENDINKEYIKEINNKINNEIIEINNNDKDREILIKEVRNKIEEIIYDINDKIENKKINEINENIDNKFNELKDQINYNEYINKINYKFKSEPQNLKFKCNITNTNTGFGWNDIFEVFICYKDNNEYIISPNYNNNNLDIFKLLDNKKKLSLKGHKNNIRTIRYFINKNNYNINEYLISGDDNKIIIIWDITNNYNIKYKIISNYEGNIYSCLLIFPQNNNDNYIITSTYNKSDDIDKSATKIISLNNGQFIKYINNTNNISIYYLLSWYNKKNNKYYIIQFSYKKLIINNLFEEELYSEFTSEPECDHLSGFIYNRNKNDYLCTSSYNGYVNIWDLYNKKLFKIINTNECQLAHIIEWNNKYIITADVNNKSFKIIDLDENKVICNIDGQHEDTVYCIKKIYHPIYGESLLSAGKDNCIKLWTI